MHKIKQKMIGKKQEKKKKLKKMIEKILKEYIEERKLEKNLESEKMIIRIKPLNDLVFKNVFFNNTNKNFLICLLNEILDKYNEPIEDIELVNVDLIPEQLRFFLFNSEENKFDEKNNKKNAEIETEIENFIDDNLKNETKVINKSNKNIENNKNKKDNKKENEIEKIKGKKGYMDILIKYLIKNKINDTNNKKFLLQAKTKSDIINIEVQLVNKGNIFKKSIFNSSSIIMDSLPANCKYNRIPDLIMINLLNYNMFHNKEKYHWSYALIERELKKEDEFSKMLNFHFIELEKFEKISNGNKNKTVNDNPWIHFLINPNDIFFRNEHTPKEFKKAREQLVSLQEDPKFYLKCVLREMELADSISGLEEVEERGEERGKKRGIEIGKKIMELKMIFKLIIEYRINIRNINHLVYFNNSQLLEIKKFINDSNYKIKDLVKILDIDENEINGICKMYKISIHGRI